MSSRDQDEPYRVAYDEAVRALGQQETAADGFKTRAGMLISAAAITTSFLGANALDAGRFDIPSWMAVATFLGVVGFCLAVLWPTMWEFSANPGNLIATYIETVNPMTSSEIHRDLALHMGDSNSVNADRLDQLIRWFRIAAILLALEILLSVASYAPWS